MNLIKARFLRDGEPSGREYTYLSNIEVEVGDTVQLNERGIGVVTDINIPESKVESFKDKLKIIIGKINEETKEATNNE